MTDLPIFFQLPRKHDMWYMCIFSHQPNNAWKYLTVQVRRASAFHLWDSSFIYSSCAFDIVLAISLRASATCNSRIVAITCNYSTLLLQLACEQCSKPFCVRSNWLSMGFSLQSGWFPSFADLRSSVSASSGQCPRDPGRLTIHQGQQIKTNST